MILRLKSGEKFLIFLQDILRKFIQDCRDTLQEYFCMIFWQKSFKNFYRIFCEIYPNILQELLQGYLTGIFVYNIVAQFRKNVFWFLQDTLQKFMLNILQKLLQEYFCMIKYLRIVQMFLIPVGYRTKIYRTFCVKTLAGHSTCRNTLIFLYTFVAQTCINYAEITTEISCRNNFAWCGCWNLQKNF